VINLWLDAVGNGNGFMATDWEGFLGSV